MARTFAPGLELETDGRDVSLQSGADNVSLTTVGVPDSQPKMFAKGAMQSTPFGDEIVTLGRSRAEVLLTVDHAIGIHTWSWQLNSSLEARLSGNGQVGFFDRSTDVLSPVEIAPVAIYDADGRNITPPGSKWGLQTRSGHEFLTLTLNDRRLPLPYTVDPILLRDAATSAIGASGIGATIPSTTETGDLIVVHVGTARVSGNTIATPTLSSGSKLTALTSENNSLTSAGTDQRTYYVRASATDAGATVTATWSKTAVGALEVLILKGTLDKTSPLDVKASYGNAGTASANFQLPGQTPSVGDIVVGFAAINAAGAFSNTAPSGWNEVASSSDGSDGISLGAYTFDCSTSCTLTGTDTNVSSGAHTGNAVADTVSFKPDTTAPASDAIALVPGTNSSREYFVSSGNTLYYSPPSTGTATFSLEATPVDLWSGPDQVAFPDLSGTAGFAGTGGTVGYDPSGTYASSTYTIDDASTNLSAPSPATIAATDNAGNSLDSTLSFVRDTTAPATSFTFPTAAFYNDAGWTGKLKGTESESGSGLASLQISIEDETAGSCYDNVSSTFTASCPNYLSVSGTTSWTFSVADAALTDSHAYTATLQAIDNVSNTSTVSESWTYDVSGPTATVTFPSASAYTGSSWDAAGDAVAGTAADPAGVAGVSVSIEDSTAGKCYGTSTFNQACPHFLSATGTDPWSHALPSSKLTDGDTYTVTVETVDQAKNANTNSSAATATWVYDNTAPALTIDSQPRNPTNLTSAVLAFHATDASTVGFTCSLDGSSPTPCTSGSDLAAAAPLGSGTHTAKVVATDAAGNSSQASVGWTVDLTPPAAPTFVTEPSDPSNDPDPAFSFSGESGATFVCSLDSASGPFSACAANYVPAGDGLHVLYVEQTDVAGNTGPAAAYSWVLDTTAPDPPTVTTPAAGSTTGASVTPAVSTESGATLSCALDSGPHGACQTLTGLSGGSHTLHVTATDAAGNTSSSTDVTWTVDTTPPETTIESGPADPSDSSSATFSLTATTAGSTFECDLDNGGWEPCASSPTLSGLGEGSHTLQARATDPYGNTDPAPAAFSWTIDLTPPNAPSISRPSTPTNDMSASISFSDAESGVQFQCKLDSASYDPCTSPAAVDSLGDGSHTFSVEAIDPAGNISVPASATWVVDTAAPGAPELGSTPANPSSDTRPSFTFSGDAGASFQCLLDSGSFSPCTSPYETAALADGSHTFEVRQTDIVGNTSLPQRYTWTVDTAVPPAPTITNGPAAITDSTVATVTFASADAVSYRCALDGAGYAACASPAALTQLTTGSHDLAVEEIDAAGVASAAADWDWTVVADTASTPQLVTAAPADGATVASVGSVTLTADRIVSWTNVAVTRGSDAPTLYSGSVGETLTIPLVTSTAGLYTVTATIDDGEHSDVSVHTHFTVWSASGDASDAPPVAVTAAPGQTGTISSATGTTSVTWPALIVPPSGLVMTIDPLQESPSLAGFSAGSLPVDITAEDVGGSTLTTSFSAPLVIHFADTNPSDVPVTSSDGVNWRALLPLSGPQIPPGQLDGYLRTPAGIDVYTLHLTQFALVVDNTPPTPPASLTGVVYNGQLVLRWERAGDNSGAIASYELSIDGAFSQGFGGPTYEYYVGPAVAGDTRTFAVSALDSAGNASDPSEVVTGVPDVTGMTQEQAGEALAARGFATAVVSNSGSGGVVVSQTPAVPAYQPVGSTIDLTLAAPPVVRTPLSLAVTGGRRINLSTRHYAAVRVAVNLASTVTATLEMKSGKAVASWDRSVPAGVWIIRYGLPKNLNAGRYLLSISANTTGDHRQAALSMQIKKSSFEVLPTVIDVKSSSSSAPKVALRPPTRLLTTTASSVYRTIASAGHVGVLVIDVGRQSLGLIHSLHIVYPAIRIVAVTSNPEDAVPSKHAGASAVVVSDPSTGVAVGNVLDALIRAWVGASN